MILKIINKLTIFKKLNIKFAKIIFTAIIYLDDIFLRFRIFLITIFLKKDNRVVKALNELKTNGVSIIKNFYTQEETDNIKYECIKILDSIPLEKVKKPEYIMAESLKINDKIFYMEKFGKSIKLKGLNTINSFLNKIGRNFENNLITLIYHLNTSKPYLIYNVSHDGSSKHAALQDYGDNQNEAIASRPHVDLYLHKLRCFIALEDVNEKNGATVYFNKSMNSRILKNNHLNLFLKNFEFNDDAESSQYVDEKKLSNLKKDCEKSFLTCNKGDLALIDLKTAHYAILPKNGERQLLWFYY